MKRVRTIALGLAVSALSLGAYAADTEKSSTGKSGSWPSFKQADADSNGAISMDEARAVQGLGDNFAQYDKNGDGKLSRSEYESAKKAASKSSKSGAMKGSKNGDDGSSR